MKEKKGKKRKGKTNEENETGKNVGKRKHGK